MHAASLTTSDASHGAPSPPHLPQRTRRLLTRAEQNPRSVLADRRCLREPFLGSFLELCDGKALEAPAASLEFAEVACELAQKTGDRCHMHRSFGILAHARIAREERRQAAEVLEDYRVSALACCGRCSSDWHLRQADLRVESARARAAGEELKLSVEALGSDHDDHEIARLCFIRGIERHTRGRDRAAVEDAGTTLLELDLTAPRGYFLDTLAFLALFVRYSTDGEVFARALDILTRFRQRLLGLKGWEAVRTRLAWVEGQVLGRLGDWRRSHDRLGKAAKCLLGTAPDHHTLAAVLDRCQLYARRPNDASRREIQRALKFLAARLKLERLLHKRLKATITIVSQQPRHMREAILRLRECFIVPVPGILVTIRRFRPVRPRTEAGAENPPPTPPFSKGEGPESLARKPSSPSHRIRSARSVEYR